MALASIHKGTMTGKLNGVTPATTPSGWRTECTSTPLGYLLGVTSPQQVGDAAGELKVLQPPGHLPLGVGQDLAVLGRNRGSNVFTIGIEQLPHPEQHLTTSAEAGGPPRREGRLGSHYGLVDLVGVGQVHLCDVLA